MRRSVSALSYLVKVCNSNSINDFEIDFLRHASDPVDASLIESRLIDLRKPALNRHYEVAELARLDE